MLNINLREFELEPDEEKNRFLQICPDKIVDFQTFQEIDKPKNVHRKIRVNRSQDLRKRGDANEKFVVRS